MLTGSLVAIVTPMAEDGSVDYAALDRLVDFHIENGTSGIVAVGTTGESATLAVDEHLKVVESVVKRANKRVAVIAGTGANSTREAIELTEAAASLGVDSALSVVPYYNRPTQEGMYQHFKAIAEACPLPLILYNVPGRTVADMSNDTALRLAEIPNIIGIKDATGNLERACDLVLAGDCLRARAINDQLQGLHKQLFIEANPIPVKWAMERMGYIPSGIRLPLTRLSEACQPVVEAAMRQAQAL